MAADWRCWRRIVVGGQAYRWQMTWNDLRVRPEAEPGRLLVIRERTQP